MRSNSARTGTRVRDSGAEDTGFVIALHGAQITVTRGQQASTSEQMHAKVATFEVMR